MADTNTTVASEKNTPPSPKYPILYGTPLEVTRNGVTIAFPWSSWERGERAKAGEMFPSPAISVDNFISEGIPWLSEKDSAELVVGGIVNDSRKIAASVFDEVGALGLDVNTPAGSSKFKELFEKYMSELTVERQTIGKLQETNITLANEMAKVGLELVAAMTSGDMAAMSVLGAKMSTLDGAIKRNNASIESKKRTRSDSDSESNSVPSNAAPNE